MEVVVEEGELAHRIVELEDCDDKGEESALGHDPSLDLVPADQQQERNGYRADRVHEGRADRLGADRAQVGAEEPAGGLLEAQRLPQLHVEGFHDAVAGDGFMEDVLDLGELVLAGPGACAAPERPILRAEPMTTGTKSKQNPG